ncbi:MAG: hypothetical protein EXS31_10130 [Pedosphaera sp.]|nr:hypothetical protein [Pedosphaera sp.]
MNIPNYFLSDLPKEASLTPSMLSDACYALKRNRAQYLSPRSTDELIRTLDSIGRQWLLPEYPWRKLALERGPEQLHFTRQTLERGLDSFFRELTGEKMESFISAELGHRHRLDDLVMTGNEHRERRSGMARGPELLLHITAGNVPNPTLMSMVLGILTRSAQFVKCASGSALLPGLFAHSIYETDPKLGACIELAEWPGGKTDLEDVMIAEADIVTVTGADETIDTLRKRLPSDRRCLAYGNRMSFGYITKEAISGFGTSQVVEDAATDVIAWNQLGCLSPHLFYVESGGRTTPDDFASLLATELDRREQIEPRGPVPMNVATNIASRRSFYEVRAAHSPETRLRASPNSTAWTVVFENDPTFILSCLHRFVHVKAVENVQQALRAAEIVRGKVSSVGIAAAEDKAHQLAVTLARWGATRICPLGKMQTPPFAWRHDGRPALADLITWTDWEQ